MTMITPPAMAPAFLSQHGWEGARIETLAADASFRRYFRVHLGKRTAVLMDAPPHLEDSRPFLAVAQHLRGLCLRAPQILAADLDLGLILLEDFGDWRLGPYLAQHKEAALEQSLYQRALRSLVAVQAHAPASHLPYDALPAGGALLLAPYDDAVLLREVQLLTEWYAPAWNISLSEEALQSYAAAWRAAWQPVLAQTNAAPVLVLRDYHADNLMVLDDGALGLLDFQDALVGHAAYDLVSLLQDARRDVAPGLEADMLRFYWDNAPARVTALGQSQFEAAYQLLGAQRNTKIIGIFTRLYRRDGKAFYTTLQPRVWGYLNCNLVHPALAPVREWFDCHIPLAMRGATPL